MEGSNILVRKKDYIVQEKEMEEEDSIELIDYLKIVWKYRYFIIIGIIFCSAVVGIWSFNLQKLYKVSTILALTRAKIDFPSAVVIDSPSTIAANINGGMFNGQLRDKLKENLKTYTFPNFSFKASNPKSSNMIRITYEVADIKMGETILEFLNKAIIEMYQKKVDTVKKIFLLEKESKNNLKTRIDAISNQIKLIDNAINKEKDNKRFGVKDLSGLILLRGSLSDSLLQQEHLLLEAEKRLEKLRLSYEEEGPVKIIQNPISSLRPVKPKIKLNILLAGVVGLFLSLFLAFFIEYIKNSLKDSQKED